MQDNLEDKITFFVNEMNRRLVRTKEPYFVEELNRYVHLHTYVEKYYHVDKAKKYYYVRDNDTNFQYPKGYVFIKVDTNGNFYLPNGKVILGSVYSEKGGTEYLDTMYIFSKNE